MKPGLYSTVSMPDYCADNLLDVPTLNSGCAHRIVKRSPFHGWWEHPRLNPNYAPDQSKPADIGTAAHALLLQSDERGLAILPYDDYRKKAAQEQRDEAYAQGLTPILENKLAEVQAMVRYARAAIESSELSDVFKKGDPEQTAIAEVDGVMCRARPDWLNERICLHYKTCTNAEPGAWIRGQLQSEGYDMAHQFYERVLAALGMKRKSVFLVQETTAPFACALVSLTPAYAELAAAKVQRALSVWRRCLERDEWPPYPLNIHYAEPKPWQLDDEGVDGFAHPDPIQLAHGIQP